MTRRCLSARSSCLGLLGREGRSEANEMQESGGGGCDMGLKFGSWSK